MGIDTYVATVRLEKIEYEEGLRRGAKHLLEFRLNPTTCSVIELPDDRERFVPITKGIAYWLVGDTEEAWPRFQDNPHVSEAMAMSVMDLTNWPTGWEEDDWYALVSVEELRAYDRNTPPIEGRTVNYERYFEKQLDPILDYADSIGAQWLMFMFRDVAMVRR